MYKKLYLLLSQKDKRFAFFLIFLSALVACIEVIGITSIMPFITLVSDPSIIQKNQYLKGIYAWFAFQNELTFILIFGVVLLIFFLFRSVITMSFFYLLAKFSRTGACNLSVEIFKCYLNMSYQKFSSQNKSQITKVIAHETEYLGFILSYALLMLSEILVLLSICLLMMWVNWQLTVLVMIFLLINGMFLIFKISKKIKQKGKDKETFQKVFYEMINSTFSNFKTIKLQGNQKNIVNQFYQANQGFSRAYVGYETLFQVPRIFLETIGFSLVILMIMYSIYIFEINTATLLATLSVFAVGLYRLMPSANRILSAYNYIQYYHKSVDLLSQGLLIETESLGDQSIEFHRSITFENVSFGYHRSQKILNHVNIEINKGEKVAFIGASGSGKTTLIDLLIGLHQSQSGRVMVDNTELSNENIKAWRSKIGYITQDIYLFDGTVAQNVCFGHPYNEQKIKRVLKQVQILEFLEREHQGVATHVGEGGMKLSGGQKQRIGIARVLYSDPEILILDEATSAMDEKIEREIIKAIYQISADKTLIIIAHRLSTIEKCGRIFKIYNQSVQIEK